MVSYVPSKLKAVLLLSTEHHDDAVSGEDSKFKPDIILHYNKTKGAVDITDKMVKKYSTRRITNRWPMATFGQLLDISGLNAFILWSLKFPNESATKDCRRKFLLEFGESLIKGNAIKRFGTEKNMHTTLRNHIIDVFPELANTNVVEHQEVERSTPGRCYICDRKKDRKCRQMCSKCNRFVCAFHSKKQVVCEKCQNKK